MKLTKRILSAVLTLSLTAGVSIPAVYEKSTNISAVAVDSANKMQEVADELRQHLVNRETEFEINIPSELLDDVSNIKNIISLAVKDTSESSAVEGDYLAWILGLSSFEFSYSMDGYVTTSFEMEYCTTAEQEAELTEKVAEILDELDVYSANDYEKIKAVYDYVLNNVTYNLDASDLKYSAYGACINGEAICQGYSLLMYRLLSELGINVRCIPGDACGGSHMWNMVELYGKYYYIDATFDDGMIDEYQYFLRGSEDFDSYIEKYPHEFKPEDYTSFYYADYTDGDFLARFDISPTAFDPSAPVVTNPPATTVYTTTGMTEEFEYGDLNHDGEVSVADLVYCSNYVLAVEKTEYSCDLNNDNRTDVFDVIIMRGIIGDKLSKKLN